MKKQSTLPKPFQKMLGQLKKLDDDLGISDSFFHPNNKQIQRCEKEKARKKLLNRIWENWPRKMILSKKVLQMRGNALKNPEIKTFLNKIHMRIEDCALVDIWDEEHMGQQHDCPADCSPENIRAHLTKWGWGNIWLARHEYHWGGPKDPVKILFEKSKNNLFKVIGVTQMFPEKMKRAA